MENNATTQAPEVQTKFCKHCGAKIPVDAVLCTACGRQVEELKSNAAQPSVVINNSNSNVNSNVNNNGAMLARQKNKWVALILCILLGYFGAHKFYEGKAGMGILYLFTVGLFGIGVFIDFIVILLKPNPYYV
ncbi:MAG: TM2 domain-containing protein [Oscillospiraceae bacterium]|nr:TM2 domain-containing protein [Oscillospiraceae bacterium]